MKKMLMLVVVFMLFIPLAACGGGSEAGEVQSYQGSQSFLGGEAGTMEVPPITNLLIGTLMLEETDLAVDPAMAMELLPLWQAARTIFTSNTSASEEQEAILDQIVEVMKAEQIAAIDAMELTTENMRKAMSEMMGDALPEGMQPGDGSQGGPFGGQGRPQGLPGSQPGQSIGGPGPGEGISPEARATMQAERGGRIGIAANPRLFGILIDLLQERADEG